MITENKNGLNLAYSGNLSPYIGEFFNLFDLVIMFTRNSQASAVIFSFSFVMDVEVWFGSFKDALCLPVEIICDPL